MKISHIMSLMYTKKTNTACCQEINKWRTLLAQAEVRAENTEEKASKDMRGNHWKTRADHWSSAGLRQLVEGTSCLKLSCCSR